MGHVNVFDRAREADGGPVSGAPGILAEPPTHSGGTGETMNTENDPSVVACQCDTTGACTTNQTSMRMEDELFVCIRASLADTFRVARLSNLTLFQSDGRSTSQVINGRKVDNDSTWVMMRSGSCTVRTRIHEKYFQPSYRGRKRKWLQVEGSVVLMYRQDLQSDAVSELDKRLFSMEANFHLTLPLRSFPLLSYIVRHKHLIAFFAVTFLLAAAFGFLVFLFRLLASSRRRSCSIVPHARREKERVAEVYNIWQLARGGRDDDEASVCTEATSVATSFRSTSTTRTSARFEETKEEILPHDTDLDDLDSERLNYTPSSYHVRRKT